MTDSLAASVFRRCRLREARIDAASSIAYGTTPNIAQSISTAVTVVEDNGGSRHAGV
jgi:hypothetical protein